MKCLDVKLCLRHRKNAGGHNSRNKRRDNNNDDGNIGPYVNKVNNFSFDAFISIMILKCSTTEEVICCMIQDINVLQTKLELKSYV